MHTPARSAARMLREPVPIVMHAAALIVATKLIVSVMQLTTMPGALGLEVPLRAASVLLSLGLTIGALHFWQRRDLRGFAAATLGLSFWSLAHLSSFYVPYLLGCHSSTWSWSIDGWNAIVLAAHVFLAGVSVVYLAPERRAA